MRGRARPGSTPYAAAKSEPASIARMGGVLDWLSGRSFARVSLFALGAWALVESADIAEAIWAKREDAQVVTATAIVVLLSALVSSIAGFAFSALAGTALAYLAVDPLHAVQTMVLCSVATQLYAVWKLRESISWPVLWPMVAAGAVTIPIGVWVLVHVDGAFYGVGLGAFLTAYGCYVVMRRETRVVRGSVWHDATAGALGGLAGGLAGLPGSVVTIWCGMRGWDKLRQRAVYQPYILAMQIVTIACLRWQSPSHGDVARNLCFVPFALLGAIGGLALYRRLTNKQFHMAVSLLLVVSGVGLLARAL